MSKQDVIKAFCGDYVSDGTWSSDDSSMNSWFPPKDVQLSLRDGVDSAGEACAKIQITAPPEAPFAAEAAIERVVYRVVDQTLVAEFELAPGLLLTETLQNTKKNSQGLCIEMKHILKFPNGKSGFWICKNKKIA
jgi:hypothetical protein